MILISDAIKKSENYLNFVNEFERGETKHAYVVVSPDKSLREAFLNEVVALILENKNLISANSHPDYILLTGNDKGNVLVEDVLKAIDKLQFKSSLGKYKVFAIRVNGVLSERVQNKLLKTLEEPPQNTIIFLCVSNITNILPTILSRVEKIVLKNLDKQSLLDLGFDLNIVEKSENMLYLCQQLTSDKAKYELVESCLNNMKKSSEIINYSRKFCKNKDECLEYLFYFGYIFKLLIKQNLTNINLFDEKIVSEFNLMVLSECVVALDKAQKEIMANCALSQVIDKFLLKILEIKYLCK